MWRGLQTLYAIVPGAIVSRFGGFLAYYCSEERESASISSFWYHQQIVLKTQRPRKCELVLSGDTSGYEIYQEGGIDREKRFFDSTATSR